MCSFLNLLSDDNVDFEKCGDVVLSTKDNMIGLYCRFCCDIFTNLNEFFHHLQLMHNDVLHFTKEHNVYSIEELMCPSDQEDDIKLQTSSSCNSVSGAPVDAAVAIGEKNHRILNTHVTYKSNSIKKSSPELVKFSQADSDKGSTHQQERDVLAEVHAMLFETEEDTDSQQGTESSATNELETQVQPQRTEKSVESQLSKFSSRLRELTRKKTEKAQSTCDQKSYAIARTARRQEQQLRLSNIKKRIFRSLENESGNSQPSAKEILHHLKLKELEKLRPEMSKNIVFKIVNEEQVDTTNDNEVSVKNFPKITYTKQKFYSTNNKQEEIKFKENESKLKAPEEQPKPAELNASKPLVTKVEYLSKLTFNSENIEVGDTLSANLKDTLETEIVKSNTVKEKPTEKHIAQDVEKSVRKCSLTIVKMENTSAKDNTNPERRSSLSAVGKKRPSTSGLKDSKRLKTEDPELPAARNSLNFDLSDSVVEFLQKDLKSSQLDADSLLQLAELRDEDANQQSMNLSDAANEEQNTEESEMPKIRDDRTLLTFVGLRVLKNPNYEDPKPIELVDELRSKATKFCNILRNYTSIWNSKRFEAQFGSVISNDIAMCTEKVNRFFNIDLNVSELKRILNIINTWHSQVIDLKFFKKVTVSSVIEYYVQLFGFLPKINRCVYYCEWCKVTSSSKSRYEKHRQIHDSKFSCPQCQRGFKKRGYLINHLRAMHGTES